MVYSARKLPLTGIFRPRSKRSHYCYSPLNEDLKDIRLITLHPGDSTANLEISIQTVSLMPESPPIYEALSYAWGSAKSMTSIRIGEDSLAVTKSLANALRHLRYSEDSRALWIDAICINQQNLTERSHQVKRMADIYSLADRVVAWLGPARDQSGWGMKIIEHLGSQIEVDWELLEMKTASRESEPHWSEKFNDLPFGNEEQEAITDILSRPWFERLWVKQEIRLANCHAIVMSGFDVIAWQCLRKAVFCLDHKRLSSVKKSLKRA